MNATTTEPREDQVIHVLRDDGSLDEALDPGLDESEVIELYRQLVQTRTLDNKLTALQRQGRIGFHVGSLGEEAAIIGSTYAMRATDWIFPCYREFGSALLRGFPLQRFIDNMFGNASDVVKGRQMPDHYTCREKGWGSISSPVGTQITQAVGFAWAAKIDKKDLATLVYFGDGATSSVEFHNGMNFAGVFKLPIVFLCQNNQWAISVPLSRQTASKTLAQKAVAYGFKGLQVDGNDVFGVYATVKDALEKARRGEGPTFIECLSYRLSDHTTADDASRYRSDAEVALWRKKGPLRRLRAYLEREWNWSESEETALQKTVNERIAASVEAFEATAPIDPLGMFDTLFASLQSRAFRGDL